MFLSKRLNRENANNEDSLTGNNEENQQETSTDSDRLISEQIQGTLDFITKIENSLKDDMQ